MQPLRGSSRQGLPQLEGGLACLPAKKSLGQNFLTSEGALHKIVTAGELNPKSTVLEIGPGRGALTKKLLETGATVFAIEKDRDLIPYLSELFQEYVQKKKFILVEGDILNLDNLTKTRAFIGEGAKTKKYNVIANIPYYITGEIIRLFLERETKPEILVFLVQKEVAQRIVAKDKKESVLSLSVKAYGVPTYIGTVSRGSFFPSPNVDSAIVQIRINQKSFKHKKEEEDFFTLIKTGFKAKRKKAFSNILPLFQKEVLQKYFTLHTLDQNIRPEQIPLEIWLELSRLM